AVRQGEQPLDPLRRQDRRLVRPPHGLEKAVQRPDLAGVLGPDLRDKLLVPLASVRLEKLGAPPPELPLRRAPHEVVTLPDQLELQRVELQEALPAAARADPAA